MMADLGIAEIRAEGRKMLARFTEDDGNLAKADDVDDFLWEHADALLADPAPEGLTEEERLPVEEARKLVERLGGDPQSWPSWLCARLLAIIDRLTSTEEGTDG